MELQPEKTPSRREGIRDPGGGRRGWRLWRKIEESEEEEGEEEESESQEEEAGMRQDGTWWDV